MDTDEILKRVKSCISGEPLVDCKYLNGVETRYLAKWPYPCAGNLLTGESGYAVAFIHDRHIADRANLKWVVEFRKDDKGVEEVIYHDVSTLVRVEEVRVQHPDQFLDPYGSSEMFLEE